MMHHSQRGVALVTALLVVSLATVAAVAMATRQHVDVRRTSNLLHGEQAYAYALAAESWARVILRQDARDNKTDSLDEDWATALPPIAVEGGLVDGIVRENHARFNLNNLVSTAGAISTPDVEYFKRLLESLELDPAIAGAVADWIDVDQEAAFPDGAEDNVYLLKALPYRASNSLMRHISELRLIEEINAEVYAALLPHVAVLPARTDINVNTATPNVLRALHPDLQAAAVEALITDRGETGYADKAAFLNHASLAGLSIDAGVGVRSDYFTVYTDVFVGRGRARLESLVWRDDTTTRVLYRARNAGIPVIAEPED